MDNYATIVVEKNALPSVKESIAIGKRMLERKLITYTQKLRSFETTKNMDIPFSLSFSPNLNSLITLTQSSPNSSSATFFVNTGIHSPFIEKFLSPYENPWANHCL